ncbi:TetR/AcrR family transcriptional regulator [Haloflavibacter putidus]|uniref:TetR/AcrR family transcriptional regulator n=1 Tax=Haloflavibacter putidus TaxID=2576776 RepID=A0A507ZRL9_9FLAO|nr:TetR/AcrR family transcriptional regulator [Haloflavibacter putidus]TQD40446.1 TetR/AcrR family transcriptional regulator [Haloflavibacter putidus]
MKEKILKTSTDLFLNYGFKNVTMDEIAEELGISKKTIYTHYHNKAKLVQHCSSTLFKEITDHIDNIVAKDQNPIVELQQVHRYTLQRLREEDFSPQFQLEKYYPRIYSALQEKKITYMRSYMVNNLTKGMQQGYYRPDLDVEVVYNFYFMTLEGIRNSKFYTLKSYSIPFLVKHFLNYHLRGIASEKGLEYINNLSKSGDS